MADFKDTDALLKCDAVDCRPPPPPVTDWLPRRLVSADFFAKDFDSFLRLMLDEVSRTLPGWRDRSEADLGMAILELCAYFADHVSYFQDRVVREGKIATATQFESLRSLLRLINFRPSLGRSASTYASFEVSQSKVLFAGFEIASVTEQPSGQRIVFHVAHERILRPELNALALAVDAPVGPTRSVARLQLADSTIVAVGDHFAFVDGERVEIVRVVEPPSAGPGPNVTSIAFEPPLAGDFVAGAGQVLANVALVHHGERIPDSARERLVIATGQANQRVALSFAPISRVSEDAQSTLSLRVDGVSWTEVDNFLLSDANDDHFVVTYDNQRFGTIVLGSGSAGRVPAPGAQIEIAYRVGLGRTGLVAADTLTEFDDPEDRITSVTNLVPSFGGEEPHALDELRLLGPASVRKQRRVVSLADYERVATETLELGTTRVAPLHARAERGWSGSWEVVSVFVDLRGLPAGSFDAIDAKLEQLRLAGRDVVVRPAEYAPLSIALTIEIAPKFFQRHVRAELELRYEAFFSRANFGFGDGVHLSAVVRQAMEVEGVVSVCPTRFKRLGDRFSDRAQQGVIQVGRGEIPRCDRNPLQPNDGILYLKLVGGKAG